MIFALAMGLSCLMVVGEAPRFEAPDVHEVEAAPERFVDRPLRVTGRFLSAAGRRLRLIGSQIEFELDPDVRIHANPRQIEVVGTLSRDGERLRFRVQSVFKLATEVERFARRREGVSQVNYGDMYQLGDWARNRARWYDEPELLRLAHEAYAQAVRWEEADLARRKDPQALLALADRAANHGLPETESARLRHRAIWVSLSKLARADAEGRLALAAEIQKLLPGSENPAELTPEQSQAYYQDPLQQYAGADPALRNRLHRALYVKVVGEALEIQSRRDGNLATLVEQARRLIPENQALAAKLELLALERQTANINRLTRGQMLEAAQRFKALGKEERATETIQTWLATRRSKLTESDVEPRLALAADFLELLGDRSTAAALYREALANGPLPEAEQRLESLGYVKIGADWVSGDRLDAGQQRGVSEGIQKGDSEQRVLEVLGEPGSIARTGGATWIVEAWRYDGPPRLVVYLRRSSVTGKAAVAQVTAP